MVEQPKRTTATSATKASIDLEAPQASRPAGVKAPATTQANKMTAAVALSIVCILLLVGALVPAVLLVSTASSTPTKSSTIVTDIEVHSKRGDILVHSAIDLTTADANQRWHLMVRLAPTMGSSSEALGEEALNEEETHDEEAAGCIHLLHANDTTYRFYSAACTYHLPKITKCSARSAPQQRILPLSGEMSVGELSGEMLVALMNSGQTNKSKSTFTTNGTSMLVPEGDPSSAFDPPLICSQEPSPEGYTLNASAVHTKPEEVWTAIASDVLATAILAFSDDAERNDVAKEVAPEGFFCFSPAEFKFKGPGSTRVRARTAYGPAETDGSCLAQTQVSFSTCYGFNIWGGFGPWIPWPWSAANMIFHQNSPFEDAGCKCEHDHMLAIVPNGPATADGAPFVQNDTGCNGQSVVYGTNSRKVLNGLKLEKRIMLSTGASSTNTYTVGAAITVGFNVLGIGGTAALSFGASFTKTITNNKATTEGEIRESRTECQNTLQPGDNPVWLHYTFTKQRYKLPVKMTYKQCSGYPGAKSFTSTKTVSATVYGDYVQSSGNCAQYECKKGFCDDTRSVRFGTGCY